MRPAATFTGAMLTEAERDTFGVVIAITGKTARVQLAGGDVISGVSITDAVVGQTVRMRYAGGTYGVQGGTSGGGSGSGASASGGGALTGAPSPHDLLGAHHTLPTLSPNLFLASLLAGSGLPSFRAIGPADLPAMSVLAGNGLTGGGDIRTNPTLDAAVANTGAVGLTVEADAIRLTSSSNPGATAKVLATDAAGKIQLVQIGLGTAPTYPLHILDTNIQARIAYDATHYADVYVDSGGSLKLSPTGMLIINAGGEAVVPNINYSGALGLPNRKWLTLDVAELHAEILVAREKVVTIGGRFMVAAGGVLIGDCPASA